jgi:hypothetical protein
MMRSVLLLTIVPALASGCLMELLTTTAIQGELAARDAQAGAQAINYAKESRAKIEAEQAIKAYQAEKGAYPPSLTALIPNYLASAPVHPDGRPYGYNPMTGRLLEDPLPAPRSGGFTATDQRNLDAIGDAIYRYWEDTGSYPRMLADLEPTYLARVPTLESGAAFEYDASTGAVYPPASAQSTPAAAAPVARNGGGAIGGVGPMGEVMTGIGIQNELNNMNTSGTSSAGSRARGSVAGIQDSYNTRQNRALNQLDQ